MVSHGILLFAPSVLSIILLLHSASMSFCLSAYNLRLNSLQCSQVGQLFPSPRALCLCVLSALLCCQNRRLVIQSGWRGVVLQIRPVLKELLLHASPYVAWDCLPAYRRGTFASFPLFLSLSVYLFAPSLKLAVSLGSSLNYQNYILIFLLSPTASHSALIQLSPTNALSNFAFI